MPASIGSKSVRSICFLLPVLLAACGPPPQQSAFRATGEIIAFGGGNGGAQAACATCHGLSGEGDGHLVPRLAGLDAGYLHRQMDDYANGRRDHAVMRRIVLYLDGTDRSKVSTYYARLRFAGREEPARPARAASTQASAERLYHQGDPARNLPACASCHGADGAGIGPANPPLAGQPAAYLAQQMQDWRAGKRQNDPLKEMQSVSRLLQPAEISSLSLYAAALNARPLPDLAASPSAHHGDPKNDVSMPRRRAAGSSPATK